jgi:mannosyltransferase OCH1-like enzyme
MSQQYKETIEKITKFVKSNTTLTHKIYLPKNHQNGPIPKIIFQSWHSKQLPPKMYKCVQKLQKDNPEFLYYLFDDEMCRELIKQHFHPSVVNAFDHLIPGQYKCDLWKYCVLYVHGGVYLDMKYQCVNGFKLKDICDEEHFVLERPGFWSHNTYGIYNGFMVCKPRNQLLMKCIQNIVHNVRTKNLGHGSLYPTGPGLLGTLYFGNINKTFSKIHDFDFFFRPDAEDQIVSKGIIVLRGYNEYRREQRKTQKTEHYSILWEKGDIYK